METTATTAPTASPANEVLIDPPQKRSRDGKTDDPPPKRAKSGGENTLSLPVAEHVVQSLSDRKLELENKYREVTESLARINEALEQKSQTVPEPPRPTKAKSKRASTPKTPKTKKAATSTTSPSGSDSQSNRPKRQRKKSTVLREAEENQVSLPPALESCKSVLTAVARHKFSLPFMTPVDPVALCIPDYFDVIKHPMDFETIRKKLFSGQYENVADFNADAQLVFSNACTYNHPGSDVYIMAESVRDHFNRRMKPVEERERKYKLKESGEISDLRKSVNTAKEIVQQLDKPSPRASNSPVRRPAAEVQPMSKAEMRQLSNAVNALNPKHLTTIISIIQKSMPSLSGEGEIEIDLNTLDNNTLRKLESFVASVNESNSKKRQRKKAKNPTSIEAQRELARKSREGTDKEIETVQRQIEMLRDPHSTFRSSTSRAQNSAEAPLSSEEQEVKVDESESESGSDSGSDSSESESESDSDSNQ